MDTSKAGFKTCQCIRAPLIEEIDRRLNSFCANKRCMAKIRARYSSYHAFSGAAMRVPRVDVADGFEFRIVHDARRLDLGHRWRERELEGLVAVYCASLVPELTWRLPSQSRS